jgi:hopanoid biosynthesis associated RND transporter like protein HpnN
MLESLLARWTAWVIRHAWPILLVIGTVTVIAAWFAVTAFNMNSDTSRLIRQDTEWKRVHSAFIDAFPQYDQNTFVVVSGELPDMTSKVARALAAEIKDNDDIFSSVYAPASNAFVDQHTLLYLETDTLNNTVSKLAEAQPFLSAVAQHDSMKGILNLLIDALTIDEALPTGFSQIVSTLDMATNRALASDSKPLSWRDELFEIDEDTYYQVIFVKGRQDFGIDLPNSLLIGRLEAIVDKFEHPYRADVRIRLTGQVPLEHGEIVSAMESAQLAGSLALVLLIVVLVWGVRSFRIIAATYLSMIVGLIWTAAFAMIAVGQYNTISIIFLVMFIGLGVDFAVHLCLKYQESLNDGDKSQALIDMGSGLGPAIMLCGITSAIGFISFVPTNYIGLGEMGIISGGGMIIAVAISLTLIPAFFAITARPQPANEILLVSNLTGAVADNPRRVAFITLISALILTAIASQASFDYSTLSLKDPDSEAMTTLRELHDKDIITDYALIYVADNLEAAELSKQQLLALPVVSEVLTPIDYLPDDQEEKLYILEDAGFLLDSIFYATSESTPFSDEDYVGALVQLSTAIDGQLARTGIEVELRTDLEALRGIVSNLIAADETTRVSLTELVIPPLKQEIAWLHTAISAREVDLKMLPDDLKARLITPQGLTVVSVTPAQDVVPVDAMRRYTQDVMSIVPKITGRPVLDLGIGEIVITAFTTAIFIAVSAIFVILLLTLRSFVDAILVFIPLAMTAMVTLTVSVLIDLPLNMANVVVVPLIFGLGVDNGIHIVKRFHQSASVHELVKSSTPRAVFLSNLTTLGTFCALSFSTHQGIFSIGVLLTVALLSLMLLTLVSLPALLATFSKPRAFPAIG